MPNLYGLRDVRSLKPTTFDNVDRPGGTFRLALLVTGRFSSLALSATSHVLCLTFYSVFVISQVTGTYLVEPQGHPPEAEVK
jgi:hypothetical protein